NTVISGAAVALAERGMKVLTLKKLALLGVVLLAACGLVPAVLLAGGLGRPPAPPPPDDKPEPGKPAMPPLEPGVYVCRYEGEGRRVRRYDGPEVILGERVSPNLGRGTLTSLSNDN